MVRVSGNVPAVSSLSLTSQKLQEHLWQHHLKDSADGTTMCSKMHEDLDPICREGP